MRRIPRTQPSIDTLLTSSRQSRSQPSTSPCLACNFRALTLPRAPHPSSRMTARFSTSTHRHEAIFKSKNPEKSKAFTDSIQSKIWGGKENVYGREDPYDKDSPLRIPAEQEVESETRVKKGKKGKIVKELSEDVSDEFEAEPAEYVEAKTWDGLERVGGKSWREEFYDKKRGRPHFTKGYIPSTKVTDPEALDAALHRAIAEVYVLKMASLDLSLTSKGLSQVPAAIQNVKVGPGPSQDGGAQLEFANPTEKSTILESLKTYSTTFSEASPFTSFESAEPGESIKLVSGAQRWAPGWEQIPLQDPAIKFAIIKRLTQLTGHRLSDPIIQDTNTAGQLLARITAPPPPKKLSEAIQRDGRLNKASNVKVSSRRVTSIDKKQEVGIWKVIDYALRERGLPVVRGD